MWESVIGLEIHVELNTTSKLFSSAPNHFGDEPNTNVTPVCTGHPGTLPVLNQAAVDKAIAFGCAVGGTIAHCSWFDRKSYFYPDSPRNFQITQYETPLITGGEVTTLIEGKPHTFYIEKVHLEDDAGMLKHFSHCAALDDNRAGVPLIEIVSKPCIYSAQQAVAYAQAVKTILEYLGICDCHMEEGSFRMDVNLSVRKVGESSLRQKVEIKNMNSFNFMAQAIEEQTDKQIRYYEKYPDQQLQSSTFRWDPSKGQTILMRQKETADDYRFMKEPDLPALVVSQEYIDSIAATLPELPYQKQVRYISLGIAYDSMLLLVQSAQLSAYFEQALQHCAYPKALANWILVEFGGRLNQPIYETKLPPLHIALLVTMVEQGTITGKIGKVLADMMLEQPQLHPEQLLKQNPHLQPLSDRKQLQHIVAQVVADNQQSVTDYTQGKQRAFAFLVGQVMKITQGKADPKIVHELLMESIQAIE